MQAMQASAAAKTLIILAAFSIAISACGRRAPLDTPYEAAVEARERAIDNEADVVPPEPAPPQQDRPFILDGLI